MALAGARATALARAARLAARELEWGALRLGFGHCPLCGGRVFARISRDLLGTRCLRCLASPISMAIGTVVARTLPGARDLRILELSSRGPFHAFLARTVSAGRGVLTSCEFFDDTPRGEWREGVQCQDVQQLTYAEASFDLCTSTEVFEHVPDDRRGFAEIFRVLAPGGHFVFTVPIADAHATVERARLEPAGIRHLQEPAYHDDFIRGAARVLVYRDYGRDVTTRLTDAGFADARIENVADPAGFGCTARVVVARKR